MQTAICTLGGQYFVAGSRVRVVVGSSLVYGSRVLVVTAARNLAPVVGSRSCFRHGPLVAFRFAPSTFTVAVVVRSSVCVFQTKPRGGKLRPMQSFCNPVGRRPTLRSSGTCEDARR
jgi:hypothetical protein